MLRPPLQQPGQQLRDAWEKEIVILPGVFNAMTALSAHRAGAQGLYLTGAGVTNGLLGVPDIALVTMEEMAGTAARVCQAAPIPVIADADTGFGEVFNVYRAVIEYERAGLAGMHLEDQVSPKRCGHLDGKAVIPAPEMAAKIRAAVEARRDPSFLLIARTDARHVEGLEAAIERAKLYLDAGADAIFPEGLQSEEEFAAFRAAMDAPLLANMTEFGKTPLITAAQFHQLGYQMVIFPMTAFRLMLRAVRLGYETLIKEGTQARLMDAMDTRADLYEALEYPAYETKDQDWR